MTHSADRVTASDGRTYPKDRAAHRAAIRAAIEANPQQTNTAIAKTLQTSRDTVIDVRKSLTDIVDSRYVAMCTAIAECAKVDEVKDLRDKAVALEVYARQANNFEAERTAQEIRVRAERQCGKLLKATTKSTGGDRAGSGRPKQTAPAISARAIVPPTLAEQGITYKQSSQWQQLADVPDETFEQVVADKSEPITALRIIETHRPPKAADQPTPAPVKKADPNAMHLWAVLRDLVKFLEGIDLQATMQAMPEQLIDDVRKHAPLVVGHLRRVA
ncbi:hypothetical protein [Caballeronia sp. LZ035]|uniref:hypothetical protein n=1 Tax=Caballeronia sp. LZ035 TaxID=3038568 RepID=UPI0028625F11|nr:hypothetical protein [Caballeronia sp. LZ035]MDR5757877.1 hypothetical protein [Caballeronia sp. LZ035]